MLLYYRNINVFFLHFQATLGFHYMEIKAAWKELYTFKNWFPKFEIMQIKLTKEALYTRMVC